MYTHGHTAQCIKQTNCKHLLAVCDSKQCIVDSGYFLFYDINTLSKNVYL